MMERMGVLCGDTADCGRPDMGDHRSARYLRCGLGELFVGKGGLGAFEDGRPELIPMGNAPPVSVSDAALVAIALRL